MCNSQPEEVITEYLLNPDALREHLAQRGIRQSTFARRAGINPSSLSKFMTRQAIPSPEMRERIQRATHGEPGVNGAVQEPLRFDDLFVEVRFTHSQLWDIENGEQEGDLNQ